MSRFQVKDEIALPEASPSEKEEAGSSQLAGPFDTTLGSTQGRRWIERSLAGHRRSLIALSLISALCGFAFGNTFHNGFVFDDGEIIANNSFITSLKNLPTVFSTGYWMGPRWEKDQPPAAGGAHYRPLVIASYALNYAVGGLNVSGYHLVNLLLHIAVSFVIYRLAQQMSFSRGASLAAAALFAVHPLHTEAVSGIVGRAELLMALGFLLALSWYIRSGAPDKLDRRFIVASCGAFAAALISKEQAMTLPGLLILYDLLMKRREAKWIGFVFSALRRYSGYLLILIGFLVVRAAVLGIVVYIEKIPLIDNPLAYARWDIRLLTALKIAGKYLWLFVWPDHFSADYSYNAIALSSSLWEPAVIGGLAGWGALLGLAAWSYVKGHRWIFLAVALTALTFFPASNFLVAIGTIMGERLFYLPSAGLCLLVAAGWDAACAARAGQAALFRLIGLGLFSLALVFLTARTVIRNRDWRSNETLFESAVKVAPGSAKVHFNIALSELKKDEEKGIGEMDEALRIYPDYRNNNAEINFTYGSVLLKRGKWEQAIDWLTRAVKLKPRIVQGYYNLGLAYTKGGLWKEAERAFRRAIAVDVRDAATYNTLSFVLWKQERYEEAREFADAAIQANPDMVEARYNRATALEAEGRLEEAAKEYETLLKIKPIPSAQARLNRIKAQLHGQKS